MGLEQHRGHSKSTAGSPQEEKDPGEGGTQECMSPREQMIQFITRRGFFKIYFLKIIFVDLGIPRRHLLWGPPCVMLRVLCPFLSFGLTSPRILFRFRLFFFFNPCFGLYFCVYCTIL